jgi:CDP-diglyceride synthetase
MEGFVAGIVAALIFNFTAGQAILKSEWARAQPIAFSWTPFDKKSYTIAEGELFDANNFDLNLGEFGTYHLIYSQIQIYLFVLTLFVAFITPFGGFAIAGLKRVLRPRANSFHGKVIDRLDCILIMGFFLLIFIKKIVY